jgi:Zn-finger nucleic acid-binding protein
MEIASYSCRACGARVGELARRCPYCEAPLASLRCGACFHMNVPEAAHCSGCGWELGLEPVTEAGTLICPTCGPSHTLSVVTAGSGVLHDCGRCGGQLVPHMPLREMLESREWVGEFALQAAARTPLVDVRVHYVACPVCSALMARQNFGRKSHVIVDVCRKHGVWFDAGELPRVLAFVRSGGLTRPGAHDGVPQSANPVSTGVYSTPDGAAHHAPAYAEMESHDSVGQIGRDLLDGLLNGLFGH